MFTFLKKIIIFLAPLGLIFIIPLFILISGREYYSLEKIIRTQNSNQEIIYGSAYSNLDRPYKKILVSTKKPTVVALGSSRVMQFRKEFFNEPDKFINAGGGAYGLIELEKFIKDLSSDSGIKLIILNLDQEMFKSFSPNLVSNIPSQNVLQKWLTSDWRRSYIDYFYGKFSLYKLFTRSKTSGHIGLNALINEDGFRPDGSYQYGKTLLSPDRDTNLKAEFSATMERVTSNRGSFLYYKEISNEALSEIDKILQLCQEHGIYVIGYLPPFPQQFYQKMLSVDDIYKKNMLILPEKLNTIFSERDFSFYDFSDIRIIGANDKEFVDAQHGTDKMYLRMAIYISLRDKNLSKYTDFDKMQQKLQNIKKDFIEIPF